MDLRHLAATLIGACCVAFPITLSAQSPFDPVEADKLRHAQEDIEKLKESTQKQVSQEAYNPEAAVAAGIKPAPPILGENDALNLQLLQRYGNALDKYNANIEARKQAIPQAATVESPAVAVGSPLDNPSSPQFRAAVQASRVAALRAYPQYGDSNSELSKKMVEIADRLEAQKNPLVYSYNAPFKVAQMAANELGIAPKP